MPRLKDIWLWFAYPVYTFYKDVKIALSVFFEIRKMKIFSLFIIDLKYRIDRADNSFAEFRTHVISRGVIPGFNEKLHNYIFRHLEEEIEKEKEAKSNVEEEKHDETEQNKEDDEAAPEVGERDDRVLLR